MDSTRDRARVHPWQETDRSQEVDSWEGMHRWHDDPWQESLERSLARRGKSTTGVESNRPHPPSAKRLRTRLLNAKTIAAVGSVAAILAAVLATNGPDESPPPARAAAPRPATAHAAPRARHARGAAWRECPLAITTTGYVNPLEAAIVSPERIDQGVDYAGIGKLVAIGAGRITHLARNNSGWPGAFIEYQLLGGADAGCYVYYAEGVTPADGLHVGDTISAGQPIATIIPVYPTGIEIGWGAGTATKAYARVAGQWIGTDDEDNIASAAGKNFSALIAALGGPPGKNEG